MATLARDDARARATRGNVLGTEECEGAPSGWDGARGLWASDPAREGGDARASERARSDVRSVPAPMGGPVTTYGFGVGSCDSQSSARSRDSARGGSPTSSEDRERGGGGGHARGTRSMMYSDGQGYAATTPSSSRKHANLYVKNISERVDELTLRRLFEACGEVQSCCVIRDVSTNKSRGFGFVKFVSTARAEDAIERFNGKEYAGKMLEVKFANTDGESDGAGGAANAPPSDNVYVKGLPPSWTHDDLKAFFTHFGHIVECRLLHANRSTSSGALIRFLRESEATAAVTRANGRLLVPNGPPLVVRYAEAQGKNNKRSTQVVPVNTQRLSNNTDDSAHDGGELIDVLGSSMNLNRISSQSGLTELLSVGPQDGDDFAALAVLGSSPSHKFDAPTQSHQKFASATSMAQGGATMCIQNLPPAADELFLYKTFAPFGAINSVQIVRDDWTGLCSGVAVINFRSYSDACDAQRASQNGKSRLSISVQLQTANLANF